MSWRRRLAILGVFAASSVLTRALFLRVPFLDLDEAAHLVGSWTLLDGGRLYHDFADNKPPLLYVYYAAAQLLFGRGLPAVRLATALLTLPLTAFAASAFYRHDRRGLVAGLVYIVYGASFLAHDMHAVHAEVVMLLPAAWAVALLRDAERPAPWRAFLAGALLGLATLVKQQAALWLAAPVVCWAFAARDGGRRRPALTAAAALGLGFAVPLAATAIFFRHAGRLGDLVYWTVTWNLTYAANPIPTSEALLRAARSLLPFLLVTAPLWWASRRARRDLPPAQARFILLLLLLALPPVVVGLRFFPHYFVQLYLPLALGSAPALSRLLTPPLARPGRLFVAWTAAMLVGFTAANAVLYLGRARVYAETLPVYDQVAARLRTDRCFQGATLFVWGYAPMFYAAAGLPPASRFVVPQASLTGYVPGNTASARGDVETRALIDPRHWDLLIGDLERRRATYVLDVSGTGLYRWGRHPAAGFPRLQAMLDAEYERLGEVSGVAVWRRRGCGP